MMRARFTLAVVVAEHDGACGPSDPLDRPRQGAPLMRHANGAITALRIGADRTCRCGSPAGRYHRGQLQPARPANALLHPVRPAPRAGHASLHEAISNSRGDAVARIDADGERMTLLYPRRGK